MSLCSFLLVGEPWDFFNVKTFTGAQTLRWRRGPCACVFEQVVLYNGMYLFTLCVFDVRRFKNGQGSGLDGGQYRVYVNGTLEIIRARMEDEGTYTCVASSMLGKAENQVRLEVKGQSPLPPSD